MYQIVGDMFEIKMLLVEVISLPEDSEKGIENIVTIYVKPTNLSDEVMMIGMRGAYPFEVSREEGWFKVVFGEDLIDDQLQYLKVQMERLIQSLSKNVPGWGEAVQGDGQTLDEYHNLD